jgi:hypothetical protein
MRYHGPRGFHTRILARSASSGPRNSVPTFILCHELNEIFFSFFFILSLQRFAPVVFSEVSEQHHLTMSYSFPYETEVEVEEDCRKLTHIITIGTRKVEADWSPYSRMSPADVHKYVSLQCPKRTGVGPLTTADLDRMMAAEFADFTTIELVSYWNILQTPCLGHDPKHPDLPFLSAELTKRGIPHEAGKKTVKP